MTALAAVMRWLAHWQIRPTAASSEQEPDTQDFDSKWALLMAGLTI